jgi:hypothetical protein
MGKSSAPFFVDDSNRVPIPVVEQLPLDRLAPRLAGWTGTGPNYSACCPAHDDGRPSLSIREEPNGRLLLCCHAGCPTESILSAIGWSFRELWPSPYAQQLAKARGRISSLTSSYRPVPESDPPIDPQLTVRMGHYREPCPAALAPWADQLGLPVWALRLVGCGVAASRLAIPEYDQDGNVRGILFRYEDGSKKADYGHPRGLTAPPPDQQPAGDTLYLTEGGTDCMAALAAHLPAIGRPAANQMRFAFGWLSILLAKLPYTRVVVVGDRDRHGAGLTNARAVADRLRVHHPTKQVLVALPGGGTKDLREQFRADRLAAGLTFVNEE